MTPLTAEALEAALPTLPGWNLSDGKLVRTADFADFAAAMDFVNRVAAVAESAGHHPDIDIRYNRVTLGLITHDAGGISRADVSMAGRLNEEM